ncbi:39S ribosomal protein L19, mitochondrial [Trichonephila clavipes]|uniref:Large ribosomal subunit protein bL19m n=1 Tax=Trichonephila clavipes TaxID=2585209 RepID=A0A8X6RZE1_TRICX|nr:39S ribosomal protein L19, mitochondrial [Trichonephila clavipes]
MDEEANFPIAASVLRNNLYMDDAATLEEAIVLRQQLKGILKSAGMELHKLCVNHEKLSPNPEQNYNFASLTETKTDVLSTIAKIFDPVGLMAPVISKAKIFLQRLWRSKLEWNDLLPAEEYREWQQLSLENINNIEIPRHILVAFPEVIEIHGFADASERCYGAAVYCKSKNLKSETLVRLITSKSRVAPIKSLTIPRLELCAAVLLAKLVKRVVAALQLETAELYLWSDSMIVLAWLRKEPMDLKTFVQNRVAKIQQLYPNQLWRHVPSDQNPADLVSRRVDPDKLLQQNLWFNGPTFLSGDDYPNRTINCREKLDEYNSELKNYVNEQIENFQSVLNIHVCGKFKGNINKVAGPLTTKEFEKAGTFLVKKVQEQEFSSDINHLKKFLPDPKFEFRNKVREKLERQDMLKRRAVIDIPEFYVGSILAVTASDAFAPGKENRFVGICIGRTYCGLRATFTLRNIVDQQGVEIMYDLYNPTLLSIEVLRLEKRLDEHLYYLRDAPPEYSVFPFDMEPEFRVEGEPVIVNPIKVKLNPPPWCMKWEVWDLKGIEPIEEDLHWKRKRNLRKLIAPVQHVDKYDLMKEYRRCVPEEDQREVWQDVEEHRVQFPARKQIWKRTLQRANPKTRS